MEYPKRPRAGRRRAALMLAAVLALFSAAPASAFLFDTKIESAETVAQMSDAQVSDAFVFVMVDIEAATVFGEAAGFTKSDFDNYKALLWYRVRLMRELERRQLPVPKIKP